MARKMPQPITGYADMHLDILRAFVQQANRSCVPGLIAFVIAHANAIHANASATHSNVSSVAIEAMRSDGDNSVDAELIIEVVRGLRLWNLATIAIKYSQQSWIFTTR